MPLSYPIIEARFQLLDASLAQMNRAKYTRLNASDSLREKVREQRKSAKRLPCTKPLGRQRESSCNQTEAKNNIAQLSCKGNIERSSLSIGTPPAFPTWGTQQKACDKNEAHIHAAAQESWQLIDKRIQSFQSVKNDMTSAPPSSQARTEKAKSAGYSRPPEPDSSDTTRRLTVEESKIDLVKTTTEAWTHSGDVKIPERPPARQARYNIQKPAPNQRIRCHSAAMSSKVRRNWFKQGKPSPRCPVKPSIPSQLPQPPPLPMPAATPSSEEPVASQDSGETNEATFDDFHSAAFYHLEIRLEHSSSLSGWCFRVIIADITAIDRPRILLSNMKCDENHCILFTNPTTKATSTIFNPLEYFDHVQQPIELYRHTLHIQVISELPVQKPIVDTYVHYTRGNDNELPIDLEPLHLESEVSSPPCSTLDNSAYVYANHFNPKAEKCPQLTSTATNTFEARKKQLEQMRDSMRYKLLQEQTRLSSSKF